MSDKPYVWWSDSQLLISLDPVTLNHLVDAEMFLLIWEVGVVVPHPKSHSPLHNHSQISLNNNNHLSLNHIVNVEMFLIIWYMGLHNQISLNHILNVEMSLLGWNLENQLQDQLVKLTFTIYVHMFQIQVMKIPTLPGLTRSEKEVTPQLDQSKDKRLPPLFPPSWSNKLYFFFFLNSI